MRAASFWLGLFALACGAKHPAESPPSPVSNSVPAKSPEHTWLSKFDRDHALVGKIWDARARGFQSERELLEKARSAKLVLLGERHDNPDHHRLQARVLQGLVQLGRRPGVVLEMLEIEQQPAVDEYRARGGSVAGFGTALGWDKSSWPPFQEYQPIFEVAFAAGLPILAGNLSRADAKTLVRQGLGSLGERRTAELGLDRPFPATLESALLDELKESHCNHLPEHLLAPMALAQHARDAQMASILSQSGDSGAVLVAGAGHVRRDRGVPYYLAQQAPSSSVVSLAMLEVEAERSEPAAYVTADAEGIPAFDFVWFTPRRSNEDPCAAFRAK